MTHIPYKLALGNDWGFSNPLDFFNIKFFVFTKAIGGHGNTPPQLECILSTINSIDNFLFEIKELMALYCDTNITISKNKENLKINFFEWALYDYDFQLAEKIENIIIKYNLNFISKTDNKEFEVVFKNECEVYKNGYNYIETRTNLSHTSTSIYFSCNLKMTSESNFIEQMKYIFNDFEFDELKFHRNLICKNIQFQVSFIKHKTILSQKGKYIFDTFLLDNKLYQVCKDLNINIGYINSSSFTNFEVLSFKKNIS